jgi:hypothetical protein
MDIAREKRVIRLFEEALDWPPAAREARLTRTAFGRAGHSGIGAGDAEGR